jgi:RHS repeat-associated protein
VPFESVQVKIVIGWPVVRVQLERRGPAGRRQHRRRERWRYLYDPFGRRIKGEAGRDGQRAGERIEFTWAADVLVEERRTGPDGVTRVTTDSIGTPTGLVSADGELAWQRTGTLFGLDAPGTQPGMPLRMPGQYLDDETGLHYNHQRYYDPATGRYLSPDPLGLAPAPNPVTYVRNPLTHTDPLGLGPVCPTYFGMFPAPASPYITHVGPHGETKQFSSRPAPPHGQWPGRPGRESEHVMPMAAIRGSGIPTGWATGSPPRGEATPRAPGPRRWPPCCAMARTTTPTRWWCPTP